MIKPSQYIARQPKSLRTLVAAVVCCASSLTNAFDFRGTAWEQVHQAYGIDPRLLYSVAIQESGLGVRDEQGRVIGKRPSPYAIRVDDKAYYFNTRDEALHFLESQVSLSDVMAGDVLLDVGLFQINLYWQKDILNRISVADLLKPEVGMFEAARILRIAMDSVDDPNDLELKVGRYHHWKDENRARRYGRRVLETYRTLTQAYQPAQPYQP
jgi:hypothetical protein